MTNKQPDVPNESENEDASHRASHHNADAADAADGADAADAEAADLTAAETLVTPGEMRVSDSERTSALEALGEHFTAGRVTLEEYGERTAKVTVTKTVDDLAELFEDLPAPHPTLPSHGAPPAARAMSPVSRPVARAPSPTELTEQSVADTRTTAQKLVAVAAGASVFVALALFFVTGSWLWFLLIPGISAVAGAVWGPDWKEPNAGVNSRRKHDRRELGDG